MAKPDYLSKIDDVALQHSKVPTYEEKLLASWKNFEDIASNLDPQYDVLNPHVPGELMMAATSFIQLLYANDDAGPHMDCEQIREKNKAYGESWCKRGGTGAYHAFARKGDRLVEILGEFKTLEAARKSTKYSESIDDTIGDLRRYLILMVAWHAALPPEEKVRTQKVELIPPYELKRVTSSDIDRAFAPKVEYIEEPEPPPVAKCPSCKHNLDAHDEDGCNGITDDGEVCGCTRKGHG